MRGVLGQGRVASVGDAKADVLHAQAVRRVTGADDLDAVGENHQPDRGAGEVIAVDQRVDQQFDDRRLRHFQKAQQLKFWSP